MLVIADSSALVALSICGCLEVLDKLFSKIKVPQAVYDEVCVLNKAESVALKAYLTGKVFNVATNSNLKKTNGLGKGEVSAMSLYKELAADLLLINEKTIKI